MKPSGTEPASFMLVIQCLNQLRHCLHYLKCQVQFSTHAVTLSNTHLITAGIPFAGSLSESIVKLVTSSFVADVGNAIYKRL